MGFEIINRLKKEKGLTNAQLAELSGITLSTLDKLTAGINTNPKLETLQAICKALGCRLDDFDDAPQKPNGVSYDEMELIKKYRDLDEHGKEMMNIVLGAETARMQKERQTNVTTPADKVDTTNIVYFEEKVSAGRGWEFMDGGQRMLSVHENDLTRKADYAVSVKGDSMLPMYADGDILLVREQPDVNIGEVGIFIAAGKAYVKKRGTHSLISINEGYPDISIPEGETAVCQGKVVGVLHPEWIAEISTE